MPALIFRRNDDGKHDQDHDDDVDGSGSLRALLITLVVLIAFCMTLCATLWLLRRHRRALKESGSLPSYDAATRNQNRLTIQTDSSTGFFSEKQTLMDNSQPMPLSPDNVPEIRITFPEEEDKDGRRVSGRVVVVQVGEAGVGFVRPLDQDGLPPYQQDRPQERFDSVDMERIGGLKEVQ